MKLTKSYKKTGFIVIILFFVLFPGTTNAQLDQRCFARSDCLEKRRDLGAENPEAGFYSAQENEDAASACGSKIYSSKTREKEEAGFCLPAGKTKTEISFGGKDTFASFPKFIKYMYKWSMVAASVLAVLMVIIAGIEYMMSMGNSSRVKSAKKKAVGAISGVILLAGSYVILNTLNPALVNLRIPSVWLIKESKLAPKWCNKLKNETIAVKYNQGTNSITEFEDAKFNQNPKKAHCGFTYYTNQQDPKQTCEGNFCTTVGGSQGDRTCVPLLGSLGKKDPKVVTGDCVKNPLALMITPGGRLQSNKKGETDDEFWIAWNSFSPAGPGSVEGENWLDLSDTYAYPVCKNKKVMPAISIKGKSGQSYNTLPTTYIVLFEKNLANKIKNESRCEKTKGFYIALQVDKNLDFIEDVFLIGSKTKINNDKLQPATGSWKDFVKEKSIKKATEWQKGKIKKDNYIKIEDITKNSKYMSVEFSQIILNAIQ